MADVLAVDDLGVRLGGRPVLRDVTFQVSGGITAVLGPNGAGKSTLARALAGLIPCDGRIRLGGTDMDRLDGPARARRVAYVPQQSKLDAPIPVRRVVAQGRFAHTGGLRRPSAADDARIDAALHATDVARFADRPFTELSHGERRRVLVARALATEAPLLVLDEPTAGLDVAHALALLALLRRLAAGRTAILTILHDLGEALAWADRALLLDGGRLEAVGPAREVILSAAVRRVFAVDVTPGGGLGFTAGEEAAR